MGTSASSRTGCMSYDATPNDRCFTKLGNAMLLLKMVSACTAPVAISCTPSSPRMKILRTPSRLSQGIDK